MHIAKSIKQIREDKGMTAKEVVSAIDMGAAMYSRIETGKTEPSLSTKKFPKHLALNFQNYLKRTII